MSATTCVQAASCDGFVDVDGSNPTYCTAVTYVKDRGVTVGCTDSSHYCPNDYVTRLQMALFLQRMGLADPSNTLGDHTTAIGGGVSNEATAMYANVGGGTQNNASGEGATIAGGDINAAGGFSATVGGGSSNSANGQQATIAGGSYNIASGQYSVVSGGTANQATSTLAVVAGGSNNASTNVYTTIGGGNLNSSDGYASTIPGGFHNTADGEMSFAAGYYANANYDGCNVFADFSAASPTSCTASNQFVVRALGGIHMLTGGNQDSNYTGALLAAGSGSWTTYSDRAGKDAVAAVDPMEVLQRVAAMPVATWHYKAQDASIRHMGPMAQDFYAAFGLGETERGISVVDAQGVALAAIQGLNARLEAREAVIGRQAQDLVELRASQASMAQQLSTLMRAYSASTPR